MNDFLGIMMVAAIVGGISKACVLAYRWWQERKRLNRPFITVQSKDTLHRASFALKGLWLFIALLVASHISESFFALETFVVLACLTSPVWVYEGLRWVFQLSNMSLRTGLSGSLLIFLIALPIKSQADGALGFDNDFIIIVFLMTLAFWVFRGMQNWQNGLQYNHSTAVGGGLSPDAKKFLHGTHESGTDETVIELLALTMVTAMNINSHLIGKTSAGQKNAPGNPIGSFLVAFGLIAFELLRRTHKLDVEKRYLISLYKTGFSLNISETLFSSLPEAERKQKNKRLQEQIDYQVQAARDAFEKVKQETMRSLLFPLFDILQSDFRTELTDDERKIIIRSVMPHTAHKVDNIISSKSV